MGSNTHEKRPDQEEVTRRYLAIKITAEVVVDVAPSLLTARKFEIKRIQSQKIMTHLIPNLSNLNLSKQHSWLRKTNCRNSTKPGSWIRVSLDTCAMINVFSSTYAPKALTLLQIPAKSSKWEELIQF